MSQQSYFIPALGHDVRLGAIIDRPKYAASLRAMSLARYLRVAAATMPLPAKVDYHTKAAESIKRMYKNDRYGDCVIAAKYHSHGAWTGNDSDSGGIALATDDEVVSTYHRFCGPFDMGCSLTPVLDRCRDEGIPMNGTIHKIDGYVPVDHTDVNQVKTAIYLFGALDIATDVPSNWMNTSDGDVWDMTNWPSVGGHCIPALGYDEKGVQISTWGGMRTITWAAFTSTRYIGEAYAMLAPDWYGSDKLAPSGVDVVKLKADMDIIKNGGVPDIDPVPPVPVPPGPTPVPPGPTPTPPPVPPTPGPQQFTGSGTGTVTYRGPLGVEHTAAATFSGLTLTLDPRAQADLPGPISPAMLLKVIEVIIEDVRAMKSPNQIIADIVIVLSGG